MLLTHSGLNKRFQLLVASHLSSGASSGLTFQIKWAITVTVASYRLHDNPRNKTSIYISVQLPTHATVFAPAYHLLLSCKWCSLILVYLVLLLASRLNLLQTPEGPSFIRTSTSMSSSTTTTSGPFRPQRPLLPTRPSTWHVFGEHCKPLIWPTCFSHTIIYKLFPRIMPAIWVEVLQRRSGSNFPAD